MLQECLRKPRRVLITTDAVGGVWRYSLDLARGLNRHGIEVVLAGLGPEAPPAQRAEAEALEGARLVWVDEPLDWLATREAELSGLPGRLSSLVSRYGIDLLHLNSPSQAAGLCVDCPVVVVSHSCVVTWWQALREGPLPEEWRWQRERNRRGFDAAELALAPSESHAVALTRAYGKIDRLLVVPNAIAGGIAPLAKEPIVLAAGRWWDESKNGALLDQAAATTAWPTILAGPLRGPNGQAVSFRHARCLGEKPAPELRTLMVRAGIFVAASLFEPFGLAVLEAAQTEAALVLSDIATFRELWGEAALFFDPRDPSALAQAVNRLAADTDLRRDLGRRARRRAETFSPERQSAALLTAYADAIARSAQPLQSVS